MAQTTKTLDGNFTLEELNNTLTVQEQLKFIAVIGLSTGQPSPPVNKATFEDRDVEGELLLVPIGAGQDLNAITAQQKSNGNTFLFSTTVFVSGKRAQIAAFRTTS